MENNCDICEFVQSQQRSILETDRWLVVLGDNQAYLGRAFLQLKEHKPSLSTLDETDWQEFQSIVRRLEPAYKAAFGAEPINWSCLMNGAYRSEPANPHVHWHIYPRYKNAPSIDGVEFPDVRFGGFFDFQEEKLVSYELLDTIQKRLIAKLTEK